MTSSDWEQVAEALRNAVEAEGLRATVTAQERGICVDVIGGTRTAHDDTMARRYWFGHEIGGAAGDQLGYAMADELTPSADFAPDYGVLPWATYAGFIEDDWSPALADWLVEFMA